MARSEGSRADRFYQNPALRDDEWNRATQPPWWLLVVVIAIVAAAFFIGVYGTADYRVAGWVIGVAAIVLYGCLAIVRRRHARRALRAAHQQSIA